MPGAGAKMRMKARKVQEKRAEARRLRWSRALEQLREGRFWDAFRTLVFFRLAATSKKLLGGRNIFQPWFDSDPTHVQRKALRP